jgi:hypothetical protein
VAVAIAVVVAAVDVASIAGLPLVRAPARVLPECRVAGGSRFRGGGCAGGGDDCSQRHVDVSLAALSGRAGWNADTAGADNQ